MKKVAIKTLGCKVNSYESAFIRSLFLRNGYEIVEDKADIYVINTCTVTNESDKKSKKIINSIKRNNENSIVVAMGCFCQNKKNNIKEYINADIIIGNKDKIRVLEYVEEYIKNRKQIIKFYDINEVEFEDMEIDKFENRTRAFVKIEDGCNNFCSYCIIPYVRGRVRSKNKNEVLKEVKSLSESGHKEIVLTGIHTGQYGRDVGNYSLANLISDISKIEKIKRIRLSSIEVVEITDDVLFEFRHNNKFVSHLHVPLQSGCDKTLKNMNRRYLTKDFEEKINELRSIRSDASISTDVIVGFPNETEDDFNECYEFCKKMKFSKIHVFPYSDRTGTVASKSNEKVDNKVKKERARKLIDLSNKLEKEYNESFINKKVSVLFEEEKDGYYIGHTSNYIKLKLKGEYKLHEIYEVIVKKDNIIDNAL